MKRGGRLVSLWLFLLGSAGCATERGPSGAVAEHAPSDVPVTEVEPSRPSADARKLFETDVSAYVAALYPWRDEVVVVTPAGLVRLQNGTATEHAARLGTVSARQGDSIVFHRDGQLRAISLENLKERVLAPLERPPMFLLGSEERLAWIGGQSGTAFSLSTLAAGQPERVFEMGEDVLAAAIRGNVVYLVTRSRDGSWRIGRAALSGSAPTFTRPRRGRSPAMLAAGPDGIYFYDGPTRTVKRLGFELDREEVVAQRSICSPLSVSDRVVCARVGGVFDVLGPGAEPRVLATELGGPISRLTTNDRRAFWITDSGENRLSVHAVPLPAL